MASLLVSLFFFKQKTAYEMRISDWSSDVCSSDLRQVLDPLQAQVGMQHVDAGVAQRQRAGVGADRHREPGERIEPVEARAPRVAAGLGEIGRASGRERVCQYV